MSKVYVRDFETRSVVKEIDVTNIVSYSRFELGLLRNMDLDKYYLDDTEYLKEQSVKTGYLECSGKGR